MLHKPFSMKRFEKILLVAVITVLGTILLTSEPVCAQNPFKQTNDPALHGQSVNIHGLDMTLLYDGGRNQAGIGQPSFRSRTAWMVGGNSGLPMDSVFFGTTDNQYVSLGANGQAVMYLQPQGGIGRAHV